MRTKEHGLLLFHGSISLAALLAISFFNGERTARVLEYRTERVPYVVDMGVEHAEPLSLTVDMSTLSREAIIDVQSDESEEVTFLSVPDTWQRREVRNAEIKDVTSEESTFGFMRWRLPPHAVISFKVTRVPDSVVMHNPSGTPLKVRVNRVNLENDAVDHDVILLQQESALLW